MTEILVQYIGFAPRPGVREYTLLARRAGEVRSFTLAITNEAFRDHRARFQDAPDICFLKLQRELAGCPAGWPPARLAVTDGELEAYQDAHAPKPPRRKPPPPQP